MSAPAGPERAARAPWVSLALTAAAAAALAALVPRGAPPSTWAATFVGGLLPIAAYLALGDAFWRRRAERIRPGAVAVAVPSAVLAAAAACAALSGAPFEAPRWAALAAVGVGAAGLLRLGRGSARPLATDALAVLLVWLSVELAVLPVLPVPPGGRGLANAAKILMVPLFVWGLVAVRRWEGLGFELRVGGRDALVAGAAFLAFAAVAIPWTLSTGFARVSDTLPPAIEIAGRLLGVFVLVALPEELLFRGAIQNGLRARLGSRWAALAVASVVFGAAHLDNPPRPVEYALLATLAGVAYGWTYERTGSVVAAALVHTAVDWVWSVFFGGAR